MFFRKRYIKVRFRRRSVRRKQANRKDYLLRKESARSLVLERLRYFQERYSLIDPAYLHSLKYNRIAIKNHRSKWGSCSSKKNLNFNYKILDLTPELRDYVIVHELCHLQELHHRKSFWDMMEKVIPDAKKLHRESRRLHLG